MTSQRNRLLDVCRGVLILIVVLGHSIQVVHGGEDNPLHVFIRSFQMELFFVISGVVAALGNAKPALVRIKGYFLRLCIPYVTWVFALYVALCFFEHHSFSIFLFMKALAFSWFWFFRVLFSILILKELFFFLKTRISWLCVVPVMLVLCLAMTRVQTFFGVAHYAIYFTMGYLLSSEVYKLSLRSESVIVKALEWCGKNSLGIYAVHWNCLLVVLTQYFWSPRSLVASGFNEYFVALVVCAFWVSFSVGVVFVLKMNRLSAILFLGEGNRMRGGGRCT